MANINEELDTLNQMIHTNQAKQTQARNDGSDEKEAKAPVLKMTISKDDALPVFDRVFSESDITSVSKFNEYVLDLFQTIFADLESAKLLNQRNVWYVELQFRYIPKDRLDDNDNRRVALMSTVDIERSKKKLDQSDILIMRATGGQVSSDVSSYVKFTDETKQILTPYVYFPNNHKGMKWKQGEQFSITETTNLSINGEYYYNIIGTIEIDAIKLIQKLYEDKHPESSKNKAGKSKWEYKFSWYGKSTTGMNDAIIKVTRTNLEQKRRIQKDLNIYFSD